ncbi:hypothetical protein [Streptomyces griseoruber]|uniref:hypothetical protein n=1 Tax=Streptomyces griseoruber TaxID=1943 RepID=UPI001FD4875E|nr:hypothetical protein [Streptomyces griseoruber]
MPVIVGIGALRSRQVFQAAEDARNAGAADVLLAPVSYQPMPRAGGSTAHARPDLSPTDVPRWTSPPR